MVVVAIYACGGTTTGGPGVFPGDGATGDGPTGDGSSGGLSSSCPGAAPTSGASCSAIGLECEYGNDPSLECDVVATCSGGKWGVSTPAASPSCPTKNPATCPASKNALPQGAMCANENTTCLYPDGMCLCHMACGSQFPIGRPCDAGTPFTWDCGSPMTGCPASRPHLGEACTAPTDLECNYGQEPCESPSFLCENGTWHSQMNACPVSTARLKKEIHYLSDAELQQLSEDTQSLRLTTYRYKEGDPAQHLGFIIEDAPPSSPAVVKGRDRIDLYGYTSMTVATLQVQQKELTSLREEVEALRREMAAQRASCAKQAPPAAEPREGDLPRRP